MLLISEWFLCGYIFTEQNVLILKLLENQKPEM